MSDNLPALTPDSSDRELMDAAGQQSFVPAFPSLRVNYNDEEGEGDNAKQIPKGYWTVTYVKDNVGVQVYAKDCEFRICLPRFQYSHFDILTSKMKAISIYFESFKDEIPDDIGTFKCGKLTRKEIDLLDDEGQLAQSKVKLSRVLFGLVSMKAKDADGKAYDIVDYPCVFYARGTNYMPMDGYLNDLTRKGIPCLRAQTKLTLKKEKNGSLIFWIVQPSFMNKVEFTDEVLLHTQDFADFMRTENDSILEKWMKARKKREASVIASDVGSSTIEGQFKDVTPEKDPNDPNDELPSDFIQ